MPLNLSWQDVALRLALTMVAAGLFGVNRSIRGRAAGLRTMVLIGLASAVAMIQANLLLPLAGKTSASFAVMDLMRLPLGILTGVGFIGGGVILKRGDLVTGVTTAAALWLMSVIGLCFGGGQLGLGIAATALGAATLWIMKDFENRLPREHSALLTVVADPRTSLDIGALMPSGCRARLIKQTRGDDANDSRERLEYEILWRSAQSDYPDELLQLFAKTTSMISLELIPEPD